MRRVVVAVGIAVLAASALGATVDKAALDAAFKGLSTHDWGQDRGPLDRIDQAINGSVGDAGVRKDIERRLIAVLGSQAKRAPGIGRRIPQA